MKIIMKTGFDEFEELERKLASIKLPASLDYVKKYKNDWRTAFIIREFPAIEVREVFTQNPLVKFYIDLKGGVRKDMMSCGEHEILSKGKEYLFGREPSDLFSAGNLYFVSISDTVSKVNTDVVVSNLVSRIHFYVKDLSDEIKIARLGANPLVVTDYESTVLV